MKNQFNDKRLIKELVIVLIIKLILLFAIYNCFFDTPSTADTPDEIAEKVLGTVE
jgi:Tfp pilus assembly protein PilW